ncbi:MAG: hypothetical protein ACRD0K_29575 [Egibacteraceae bacterium]
MTAMDSLAERVAQLEDELAHADGLIERLVAENDRLRARVEAQQRMIAALTSRPAHGLALSQPHRRHGYPNARPADLGGGR